MSGRGRVLDALNLEEPDRVPSFDFVYEPKSFENILGIDVPELTPSVCVRGHRSLGLDMMCISPGPRKGWVNEAIGTTIIDEWGIKYKASENFRALPWYLEGLIKTPEMLDGYILASNHSIHPGIPGENARFMFETASRHNYNPAR